MPILVDLVARMGVPWPYAFSLLRLLSIFAAYLAFHCYLRTWFQDEAAVLGTLFVAASVPLTFVSSWWEIISDFPELLAFTLGLWAIHSKKHLGLALVTFAGTLNRETTALLVLIAGAYVVLSWLEKRVDLRTGVAALAGWLGATLPLRWWLAAGGLGRRGRRNGGERRSALAAELLPGGIWVGAGGAGEAQAGAALTAELAVCSRLRPTRRTLHFGVTSHPVRSRAPRGSVRRIVLQPA